MPKFNVYVREDVISRYEVEAKNEEDAKQKYYNGEADWIEHDTVNDSEVDGVEEEE